MKSHPSSKTRHAVDFGGASAALVELAPRHADRPFVEVAAVVDPVSAGAQKLAPLLQVLHEVLNCRVRLLLNPVERLSEMPLKRSSILFLLRINWPEILVLDAGLE